MWLGTTCSERAAAILRDAILTGRYDPGQRLNEVELSSALQISRSPVREALRKLVDEGLVVLQPAAPSSPTSTSTRSAT